MNEEQPGHSLEDGANLSELLKISEAERASDNAAFADRLFLLDAMIEVVPVGVVLADELGRITRGNGQVEKMLRHPVLHSDDVNSYGEWISYHEDGRRVQSHEYPLSRVIRDGQESDTLDVHYQRGDGTRFWMRIIGQSVRDEEGKLLGATVALIDIDRERTLQETQNVLIAELNHRVKNAFSVTHAIVSRSLKDAGIPAETMQTIDDRLQTYAEVHAKLVGTEWGVGLLADVASDILRDIAGDRVVISGPDVVMSSRAAIAFSMAFYELATNAVKYGSLSEPGGSIDLSWSIQGAPDAQKVVIEWTERGGPPPGTPSRKGFGSFITGRALMAETRGTVRALFNETGLEWRLEMPMPDESE